MKVNIIQTVPWTFGQIRSLLFRQFVYAFVVVTVAIGGLVGVRSYFEKITPVDLHEESVPLEMLSKCRSELERLERFYLLQSESEWSRALPGQLLHILDKTIPSDVWLTELIASDARIDVVGLSRSEASVSKFAGAVASSGTMLHTHLESSRMASDGHGDAREFHLSGEVSKGTYD